MEITPRCIGVGLLQSVLVLLLECHRRFKVVISAKCILQMLHGLVSSLYLLVSV